MAGHDPGVLVHTPRRAETSNEPVLAQAAQLAFFPSPPVGEGAERTKFARRVRGHSPAASCNPSSGHARIPSARPPSPITRGEGKRACPHRLYPEFNDINSDTPYVASIRSQHERLTSVAILMDLAWFSRLRRTIATPSHDRINREATEQLESASHVMPLLAQHNFVASAEDLHFPTFQSKLFRQPNGLAISGTKDASKCHRSDHPLAGNVYSIGYRRNEIVTCWPPRPPRPDRPSTAPAAARCRPRCRPHSARCCRARARRVFRRARRGCRPSARPRSAAPAPAP